MAGRIPEHLIRDIVRRADVVRLVSRYTRLQERGAKYWGLCPFHREKTPSFSVEPEDGLYYCFGCKEGGNVFTLLKKLEGLEFFEALEQLAAEAGEDLSRFQDIPGSDRREETHSLRQINELAADFYSKCLEKARGAETARNYLKLRKIEQSSVKNWRIGYAPEGWEHVVKIAQRRNISLNTVERAGLVIPRKGSGTYYDRFRNRLIFPVSDRNGRVIGFGARALDEDQDAKYLNSPETPIFNKRACFYGLDLGRRAIRSSSTSVIVEGYTDVIMAHQYGFENVVAVLGTALTESHADILSKLCEKVILLFDPDTAGQKSAEKSVHTLLRSDIEPEVALLPGGLDPCELLLKHGREAFQRCLDDSDDFLQFCFKKAEREHDLKRRDQRSKVFQRLAGLAGEVPDEVKREMLVREIADRLGIEPQSAFDYVGRMARGPRYGTDVATAQEAIEPNPTSPEQRFLSELLIFLLANPKYQEEIVGQEVPIDELFAETPQCELLSSLLERCRRSGPVSESDFLYLLADEQQVRSLRNAIKKEEKYATGDKDKRLQAYVKYIEKEKKRIKHLMEREKKDWDEKGLKAYVEMRRQEEHEQPDNRTV